jgi:predicted nuclease of predicted toxin-antitoxin system
VRLLADENFPRTAVQVLREAGFDVLWIAETNAGAPDEEVLRLCVSTERILLTFDKDFGDLAYRTGFPAYCGVVLFRITPQTPEEIAAIALLAMQSHSNWAGHFSVITRQRIRIRKLHPPS